MPSAQQPPSTSPGRLCVARGRSALLGASLLAGAWMCSKQAPPQAASEHAAQATPPLTAAELSAKAEALTNDFQRQLKGALLEVLPTQGPVAAIGLCSEKAPQIAATVAAQAQGLRVRRIGTRVRNKTTNVPTEAERRALAELTQDAPSKTSTVDGKLTYVRAIFINDPACLKCHGPTDTLAPELRAKLAELYPEDEAVGYAMGELRGAFVVTEQ